MKTILLPLRWSVFVILVLASQAGRAGIQPSLLVDRLDPDFAFGTQVQSGGKKSCADVYPMPSAAKRWTDCKSGQFSQCGGPEECTCNDPDDRLIWYECKEGSYARCEDDHTCEDTCRY